MAHTNETPNYHLPQYVGTDIINPLVDTNGAYSNIDTALKDIADAEVTDAGAIDALEAIVGDNTAGLVKDVADLQAQNGNSALTTDAQTLSAAINEVDAHTDTNTGNIADNALAITGLQNTVGNSNSGLVKDVADNASAITSLQTTVGDNNSGLVKNVTDLQTQAGDSALTTEAQTLTSAINELDSDIGTLRTDLGHLQCAGMDSVEVTADGVKTNAELLGELFTALNGYINNLTDKVISITTIATPSSHVCNILTTFSSAVTTLRAFDISHGATTMNIDLVVLSSTPSIIVASLSGTGVTYTDKSADVPAASTIFRVRFYVWDVKN